MSGWTKLRFKILAAFSLFFFFMVGLLKQILSYLFTAIILILLYSSICVASTWSDVLTAYYAAKVNYPTQKIWIESVSLGYRLWRRPTGTTFSYYKVYGGNVLSTYVASGVGNVNACNGTGAFVGIGEGSIYYSYESASATREYKYCDGSEAIIVQSSSVGPGVDSHCWQSSSYNTASCKIYDVLLQEFFNMVSDCLTPGGLTMQVGSTVYGGDASKGCDCTPEGTEFNSVSTSGRCKYIIITGDPTVSPPNINGDAPGFTHITNTTTSPPVTNPDGSTTITTTNTFPDSSQDVKTSNTVVNPDGTSTTTIITERIVGGASIGTMGTTITTNYGDGSTQTVSTASTGTTTTTLTGGGITQTQTAYSSGLSVTSATGGSSSGNIATSGSGTGTGGGGTGGGGTGGSGQVTVDPETESAVVPNASEKPAYTDSRLAGAEGKTFGDFGNLFADFSNGVKSTSLFSRFNFNDFSNSISGAASSPTQSINFGRFGAHDVDLSSYDSSFYIIKGIMLILASYLATRIVILKR